MLTGYAVTFNRRHVRSGHLFQNRYKSIVCEEDPYLFELIRYIHLNPLRAGLVQDLVALDHDPWSGHAVLLGESSLTGQATDEVLALFGKRTQAARHAYRQFIADGLAMGNRPELVGGGLRRSQLREDAGEGVGEYDARVLGGGDFVASLREEPRLSERLHHRIDLDALQTMVGHFLHLPSVDLHRRGRQNQYSEARELYCYLAVRELGFPGTVVGARLGMGVSSVSRAIGRGEKLVKARTEILDWWQSR